ncbi:MAG: alpha/beta hydrolase [Ruminococcaceae bacterium]|nr:alpha/beta hydrolase [Oscillospiraceae bacterium]
MEYGKFTVEDRVVVETFIHGDYDELGIGKRKAVIVCPGGGYGFLSEREAEPIALKFFAEGFNTFILRYSVGSEAAGFNPLCELLLTIKHIRTNSEKYRVIEDRIFVIGFSAGAHLACSSATLYDIPEIEARVGRERELCRPDGVMLCYPVIDAGEYAHVGSIQNVSGHSVLTEEDIEMFSLQKHVKPTTPPAFIWHTANDMCVPSENSLIYALALKKNKVPFEVHVYPNGNHGLALCNKETWSGYESHVMPYVEGWIDLAVNWAQKFPEFK